MIGAAMRALLAGIVDYAGLYPPAGLDMRAAVGNYARYQASEDAWALGRFVAPASRLNELVEARAALAGPAAGEWRVSALLAADAASDVDRVRRFNRAHPGVALVDVVETKCETADAIAQVAALTRGLQLYVELPVRREHEALLAATRDAGARAKIRMGGTTPGAFPAPEAVVRFMRRCRELSLPFKATAGLHHPVRGAYPLTYAPDAARATMYGFLNVLLAAALVLRGADDATVLEALQSGSTAIRAEADAVGVNGLRVGAADLRELREQGVVSFGACSFREPMDELRALQLL